MPTRIGLAYFRRYLGFSTLGDIFAYMVFVLKVTSKKIALGCTKKVQGHSYTKTNGFLMAAFSGAYFSTSLYAATPSECCSRLRLAIPSPLNCSIAHRPDANG